MLFLFLISDWTFFHKDQFPIFASENPSGTIFVYHEDGKTKLAQFHQNKFKELTNQVPNQTYAISNHWVFGIKGNKVTCYTLDRHSLLEEWTQTLPDQCVLLPGSILPIWQDQVLIPTSKNWVAIGSDKTMSPFEIKPFQSDRQLLSPINHFALGLTQKNRIWFPATNQSFSHPALKDMEQARFIGAPEFPTWLIYGGESGSFDSFAWRLEHEGKSIYSQPGILTRWQLDLVSKTPRLIVVSASNKVRSQLLSSLFGSLKFQVHLFLFRDNHWRIIQHFELSHDKDRPDKPFRATWSFETDLNKDGFAEWIIAPDDKRLISYQSKSDGSMAEEQKHNMRHHQVLNLPNSLWVFYEDQGVKAKAWP